MAARKKTTRKKTVGKPTAMERLEQELPENLRDYVRGIRRRLTALEKGILEARKDTRARWTKALREASHELGKLEERGERAWKEGTLRARRDAVTLLRRLEQAIDPKPARKKATAKKATARKASRKKGVRKAAARKKAVRSS